LVSNRRGDARARLAPATCPTRIGREALPGRARG
jgi:hypothetical protein